jgi:lysophospholipase L1-like esterase
MRRAGVSVSRFGVSFAVFVAVFLVADAAVVPRLIAPGRHPAYMNSPYWSEAFMRESRLASDLSSDDSNIRVTNGVEWRTITNHEGRWITVRNGRRVTVPVVDEPQARIILLGGSTVFCAEVPDALTWASLLARRVTTDGFDVVNLGAPGSTFASRINALIGSGVAEQGDVVVYFVGVNDAVISEQTNALVGPLAKMPHIRRLIESWLGWSNLGRHLLNRSQVIELRATNPASDAVTRFLTNLDAARRLAQRDELRVLFVVQPSELVSSPESWGQGGSHLQSSYVEAFRQFFALVVDATRGMSDVVDGTHLLDELPESPYLDHVHVQEDGNKAIADFVYVELDRRGWLDQRPRRRRTVTTLP